MAQVSYVCRVLYIIFNYWWSRGKGFRPFLAPFVFAVTYVLFNLDFELVADAHAEKDGCAFDTS